jgi:hypothetical protein
MELLQADGWLVGSRRHIGGVGDVLAVKVDAFGLEALLIEVKASSAPYMNFRRRDRAELAGYCAEREGITPLLAWWAPRAKSHKLIGEDEWPEQ